MILIETFLYGSSFKKLLELGSGIREIEYYNQLAKGLDECIVIDYKAADLTAKDFTVCSKPNGMTNLFWSFRASKEIFRHLNGNRAQVVVRSKQNLGAWAAFITAKALCANYVVRIGYSYAQSKRYDSTLGYVLYPVLYLYEFILTRVADHVIVSSEYLARKFSVKQYSLIRNSIDLRFTRSIKTKKDYVWVSVGRIIKMKGSAKLSLLATSREDGVIIGDNTSQIDLGKNLVYAKLDNREIGTILGRSKYYVSFSQTEGNPKTLMEAIFAGCIPVVTNIPAHIDVISELGYGYLVEDIEEVHAIIDSGKSNYCDSDYLRFINQWSNESVVAKELEILRSCVGY